jgi:hypothetical protein
MAVIGKSLAGRRVAVSMATDFRHLLWNGRDYTTAALSSAMLFTRTTETGP